MSSTQDNPFYHNYVFSQFDLERVKIKWYDYPLLFFKPSYVQFNDGYTFVFKMDSSGRIFLMNVEKMDTI